MTEILTESFCERCGTRYTFESAAPRRSRLGKVRTLSKGMKNFVLSDDASFSEAMAEARSEEEFTAVSHQLDAFHQTFNFCLTCRQYTCGDCWNTVEGRCLTCAPVPGMEEPAHRRPPCSMDTLPRPVETNGVEPVDDTWPDEDLSAARLSRALGLDEAETEATVEAVTEDAAFDLDAATAQPRPLPVRRARPPSSTSAHEVDDAAAVVEVEPLAAAEPAEPSSRTPHPSSSASRPARASQDAVAEYEARIAAEEAAAVAAEPPAEVAVAPEAELAVAEAIAPPPVDEADRSTRICRSRPWRPRSPSRRPSSTPSRSPSRSRRCRSSRSRAVAASPRGEPGRWQPTDDDTITASPLPLRRARRSRRGAGS